METEIQLVACAIEGEEYAIDIRSVQEIIRLQEITRVPQASSFVSGVINLRGMVIPVMDMRRRFGFPGKVPDETTRIVIINWSGLLVGILVDSVSEVIRLPRRDIEQPPSCSSNVNSEFFTGIGKLGFRLLIMLNLDKILGINSDV
ncbi:MAG: chemotaxis protein CheW [Eubacteriales bacterium]